jgi:hypothetical protein
MKERRAANFSNFCEILIADDVQRLIIASSARERCPTSRRPPRDFISIGLWGKYREVTPRGSRIFRAPWIRSFPATHIHRLEMIGGGDCWTLVIVLKAVRAWGFWTDAGWFPWRRYVGDDALARKNCP